MCLFHGAEHGRHIAQKGIAVRFGAEGFLPHVCIQILPSEEGIKSRNVTADELRLELSAVTDRLPSVVVIGIGDDAVDACSLDGYRCVLTG